MEYIIITNNRKVANLYQETNQVKFYEFKDFLHILDKVQEQVYEGRKLLSDPIISHLEDAKNPFKSVIVSKEYFKENQEFKRIIDLAVKIATQLERTHDNYSEEELEAFRFIDLKLLQEASHAFD
ncbi:hypothetical protein A2U10_09915 [Fusobacterium necrophorum subsp. funduliforme]|uniref:GrdX protein n=3 Tax=Fusobacterium necrophorum TaxID=859 RepID=A0AAN4ASJ7_9FUSO|nr:GrdX family protein [Fusobacterium necrophorum]AYV95136.1 hypothetical protein BWX37_05715 [Fusobacterium necrophorum subsp. funduliforme]AYZ74029.1 hypothetical protein EGX98_08310 [Fusobacterium necrophorum]AZW10092.1 hypothetical protein EO219_11240 [Fusobacterium necrophorum subsp. necrophorum]EFS24176.2 hypothetical protein FSEG_01783 [Fusobacterium necrophorum D12]EJU15699.1 hypothetical protein HMPREF1127_0874 [Fusobacterium necrophorum subsp. funduliforme Fnf 1007]